MAEESFIGIARKAGNTNSTEITIPIEICTLNNIKPGDHVRIKIEKIYQEEKEKIIKQEFSGIDIQE